MEQVSDNTVTAVLESHPLPPFVPDKARMLFLGSFPPPRQRWSMEFFYPNWINDFWRIMGILFHDDRTYFEIAGGDKRFDKERIISFANANGMAFYDTAVEIRRLRGNASDEHLEVVQPVDIQGLLSRMPLCCDLVTTGGKASDTLRMLLADMTGAPVAQPSIGEYVEMEACDRTLRWWRMPSSSRAYPLKLEKKAEYYRRLFVK